MKPIPLPVLWLSFFFLISSCQKDTLKILPLSPYVTEINDTIIDGSETKKVKFKYYFVENYDYGDSSNNKEILDFVAKHLDKNYKEYGQYEIHFFKKTQILNEKFVDNESEELAWHYYQDVLYVFLWFSGKLIFSHKYHDGKCLNCN